MLLKVCTAFLNCNALMLICLKVTVQMTQHNANYSSCLLLPMLHNTERESKHCVPCRQPCTESVLPFNYSFRNLYIYESTLPCAFKISSLLSILSKLKSYWIVLDLSLKACLAEFTALKDQCSHKNHFSGCPIATVTLLLIFD